jgi:hypothetical protein
VGEIAEPGDRFGAALATANFGNRQAGDLAIGAPGDTVEGGPEVGTAVVLYGSSERRAMTGRESELFRQGRHRVPDVAEAGDRFGASLGAGSFGLGRISDLAIGIPNEGFDGPPPVPGAGAVTVRFGRRSGLSGPGPVLAEGLAGVDGVMEPSDAFGAALAPAAGR